MENSINTEIFKSVASLGVAEGSKAHIDENGVQRNALGLESTDEFKHVAKAWQDKCTKFFEVVENVKEDAKNKRDIKVEEAKLRIDVNKTSPQGWKYTDGGIESLCAMVEMPRSMRGWLVDRNKQVELYTLLNDALKEREVQWNNKHDKTRQFLMRLRDIAGETNIRAVVTEKYGIINHTDVLEMVGGAFKGGYSDALCSHWHYDGDNMFGNILLPDYIKTRPDSDYGVGISIVNSETTKFTYRINPFLFRAICFNGNIWSRYDSVIKVNDKHLGNIDMTALTAKTHKAIKVALDHGNDLLLLMDYTKDIKVENPEKVIAALSIENKLTQEQARAWNQGYIDTLAEKSGDIAEKTAFGVINGLTLGAQFFEANTKRNMEIVSGNLIAVKKDKDALIKKWDNIIAYANGLEEEDIKKYLVKS